MSARILLVDDHQMMRDGLRAVLEGEPEVEVIGEAEDGREAVQLAHDLVPDVVVMDVGMPDMNGIEATRQVVADNPEVKVVALSTHDDERYVVAVLDAGASAYVLKKSASEELVRAIQAVIAGQHYLSPEITGIMMRSTIRKAPLGDASAFVVLTAREREVLQLLAEGKTSRQIGAHLHTSAKTVETQRRTIMRKLDLHSIAELTKYAVREGLTRLDT